MPPAGAGRSSSRAAGRATLTVLSEALRAGRLDPVTLRNDPRAGARRLAEAWARRLARIEAERARLLAMFAPERAAWAEGFRTVAGVDEAGRGPLAGPVVAAAVVFPGERLIEGLRDSKQLTPRERDGLYQVILASGASMGVGVAEVEEIDRLNILGATRLAWGRALASLRHRPSLVLLDGNLPAHVAIPQRTMVGGDARCASIAAASIVAKVTRDRLMFDLDRRHPEYGFARHKGYRTAEHVHALRRWGPSPAHRSAFLPEEMLALQLFPAS